MFSFFAPGVDLGQAAGSEARPGNGVCCALHSQVVTLTLDALISCAVV